jgi:hypothetical protein
MKIQIDTNRKTVQVLDDVNLLQLIEFLKGLLKEDFEKYTFVSSERDYPIYPWVYPIYIPYTQPYVWPNPTYICAGDTLPLPEGSIYSSTGVYNFDVQSCN